MNITNIVNHVWTYVETLTQFWPVVLHRNKVVKKKCIDSSDPPSVELLWIFNDRQFSRLLTVDTNDGSPTPQEYDNRGQLDAPRDREGLISRSPQCSEESRDLQRNQQWVHIYKKLMRYLQIFLLLFQIVWNI